MPRGVIDPAETYEYLVKARSRIIQRVRELTYNQYRQQFPFGHRTVRKTLVHIVDVEWWYTRILRGQPGDQYPFNRYLKTRFEPLAQAWEEQAEETRRTLRDVRDWGAQVESWWTTKRWRRGIRTTASAVAIQLLFHEVHHRAQVMTMLRALDAPVQGVDYSLLEWQWFKEHK